MQLKKNLATYIFTPIIMLVIFAVTYISLFHNDAVLNLALINQSFGTQGIIALNVFLLILIIPISLNLMEIITGEFGLERFKRIAAISIGMTTLGFAALQFIGAIATSSAEGATVVVEIIQQIAHFSSHGSLEQYGLVGMLTSNASGPWNSSIFPLVILVLWFFRRKQVGIETKQLHIPMLVQWILYAQQFIFGLDLQYTMLEIILMFITGSIFVWGMISFLISMFKEAEEAENHATQLVISEEEVSKEPNLYFRFIYWIARIQFKILTFNPLNKKVNTADNKIKNKKGGFGDISRYYVIMNGLQLTIAMTVAMFALVSSMQFLAVQIRMSDAEAALFGTAGLTSAPEAFVAFAAGPYINALLLVGSNIIDGWMSSMGQIVLLGYAEIASNGAISAIPLHPALRYLTFLSWTQGMIVWFALALYAHKIKTTKRKQLLNITTISLLIFSILYYFGGAWFSAQASGYGAEYALNSFVYIFLNKIIIFLANQPTQQIALTLNVIGLAGLVIFWSGISNKLKALIKSDSKQQIDSSILELKNRIDSKLKREDQQVIIVLDTSSDMDRKTHFFKNKWIDLVFRQAAALGLILDDDAHVPVYTTNSDTVTKVNHLLTNKNADTFIEKYIGRKTKGAVKYTPVINQIYKEHKHTLTLEHDPVLVLFITAGGGTDSQEAITLFNQNESIPMFVQFLEIYGQTQHKNSKHLIDIAQHPGRKIDNSGLSTLPMYKITDASQIVDDVLNKYPNYLDKATQIKIIKK
jgi:hypothetical protein